MKHQYREMTATLGIVLLLAGCSSAPPPSTTSKSTNPPPKAATPIGSSSIAQDSGILTDESLLSIIETPAPEPSPQLLSDSAMVGAETDSTAVASDVETPDVSETASVTDVTITIDKAVNTYGNRLFTPASGHQFTLVSVTFENMTNSAIILSSRQMQIQSSSGRTYSVDLQATAGLRSMSMVIPPFGQIHGTLGYNLPEQIAGIQWIYTSNQGSIAFDINPTTETETPSESTQANTINHLQISMDVARIIQDGPEIKLQPGQNAILVQATFQNNGTDAAVISSLLQTVVRDAQGKEYPLSLDATAVLADKGETLDGNIPPGSSLHGSSAYLVPATAQDFQWVVKSLGEGQEATFPIQIPTP